MGKQGDNGLGAEVRMDRTQMMGQLFRAALGMLDGLDQNGDGFGRPRQRDRGGEGVSPSLLAGGNGRVGG